MPCSAWCPGDLRCTVTAPSSLVLPTPVLLEVPSLAWPTIPFHSPPSPPPTSCGGACPASYGDCLVQVPFAHTVRRRRPGPWGRSCTTATRPPGEGEAERSRLSISAYPVSRGDTRDCGGATVGHVGNGVLRKWVWFGLVCPGVGAADRGRCALSPFYVLLPAPTLHKTRAAEPVNNPLTAPWNISSQRTLSIRPPPAPRSIVLEPDQGRCRLPLGAVIVVSLDDDSKREYKL